MTDPDPRVVKQAIIELRDVNKERRRTAVMKLGMLGGEEAIRTLILTLINRNEDIIVRGRAALMLGKLGDERAVSPLIEVLESAGWQTRLNAAEALGKLGDKRAIKPLLRVYHEDRDKIGEAAQVALERLGYVFEGIDDAQPNKDTVANIALPEA